MSIYRTTQGDTWDGIAAKLYGSELLIPPLIEANPDYQDVAVFSSGTVLQIPDLSEEYIDEADAAPWRDDS